jgi:hypothetical protein
MELAKIDTYRERTEFTGEAQKGAYEGIIGVMGGL